MAAAFPELVGVLSLSGLLMVLPALSNWGDLILGRECARRGIGVVLGGACNPMTFLAFPTFAREEQQQLDKGGGNAQTWVQQTMGRCEEWGSC